MATASVNITASGDQEVIAAPATAGQRIEIFGFTAQNADSTIVTSFALTDGDGGDTIWEGPLAANGGGAEVDMTIDSGPGTGRTRGRRLTALTRLTGVVTTAGTENVYVNVRYQIFGSTQGS